MRFLAHASFVLTLLFSPALCFAATHLVWTPYDADSGHRYDEYETTLEDTGTYEVPSEAIGSGTVWIDNPGSIQDPYVRGRGEVYYLPDPNNSSVRELIGSATNITWEQEGVYELDAYALSISAVPRNQFFAWLVPSAQAAPEDDFIGTIRFSITHGPPLGPPCCSSVAFLPGIQGSILLEGEKSLWPPRFWGDDVPRLALTDSGESVNQITVGGILETFYGASIYGGFVAYMDELINDPEARIAGWKGLPYDWRFPPGKILIDGVETVDGTMYLVDEIVNLASESNTGKVTLIGHSMGGLMGKAIIKELVDRGEEQVIDTFIMVGSPQLGTPQGAAALLHGNDQGIPGGSLIGGIIVDPSSARDIAQNMESAYNLMPSARYFSEVSDAPILFNTTAQFTQAWRSLWGTSLNSFSEFKQFATGAGVPRTDPGDDLSRPKVLNATRFQNAEDFHHTYDNIEFPEHIRVVQIAGWGLPTPRSFEYRTEHSDPNYEVLFTQEGDGTVVYKSAISSDTDSTYYFNIENYRDPNNDRLQHRDLLNGEPVQDLIRYLLTNENLGESDYITLNKPSAADIDDQLVISTHSPVLLGAKDSLGRFSGINANQPSSGGFLEITNDIPGSYFTSIGGDQYLFLPKSGSYKVSIKGSGTGPATIETAVASKNVVTKIGSYTDIPVTSSTTVQFDLSASSPQTALVEVDTNGDGQMDTVITPDNYAPTLQQLIATLKTEINSLTFKNKLLEKILKKILIAEVEHLEKKISKQKTKRATAATIIMGRQIFWLSSKKVVESDVSQIISLLQQIGRQL